MGKVLSQKEERMVTLGSRVKDRISGFVGIVTARTEFLHECVRIGIASETVGSDGKVAESYWIDEAQAEVVEEDAYGKTEMGTPLRAVGGPDRPNPPSRDCPSR